MGNKPTFNSPVPVESEEVGPTGVHEENPFHRGIIGVFRNVIVPCGTCEQFSFPFYEPFAAGDGQGHRPALPRRPASRVRAPGSVNPLVAVRPPSADRIRRHRTAITRDELKDLEISTRPPAGSDQAGPHSPISAPDTAATRRISHSPVGRMEFSATTVNDFAADRVPYRDRRTKGRILSRIHSSHAHFIRSPPRPRGVLRPTACTYEPSPSTTSWSTGSLSRRGWSPPTSRGGERGEVRVAASSRSRCPEGRG